MTNRHGDDFTYFNHFLQKNPIAYFGFSNLAAMVRFIEAIPPRVSQSDNEYRSSGWRIGNAEWRGTDSMGEALALARDGWPEGVELAREVMEFMQGEHAERRLRTYGVAGGRVNVGRMLSGNPMHMRRRESMPAKRNVTLFVDFGFAAKVEANDAIIRAALAGAICDVLESNGYSSEIVAVSSTMRATVSSPAAQVVVTLKAAGEKLNINDLIFSLGHPSFLRRFEFALLGYDPDLHQIWRTMGRSAHPLNPHGNEYVIRKIPYELADRIPGRTVRERAKAILPIICKNSGLPIELT